MAVATASSTYDQKIQSLQHSVLFLQKEHASTIKGLHEEIGRLQQKCSVLTFQLAQDGNITTNGTENTQGTHDSSLKSILENEIRELRLENTNIKEILETKDKRIRMLEGQLKSKEQKYTQDLKNVNRKVTEIQLENEQKAKTIAYLTTTIHQEKQKSKNENSAAEKTTDTNYSPTKSETRTQRGESFSPSPPQCNPPEHSRYNLRRSTAVSASMPADLPTSTSTANANVTGLIQEKSSHQIIPHDEVLENALPKTNSKRFSSRFKQSISNPARPSVGHSSSRREKELKLATSSKPKPSDYEEFIMMRDSQDVITKPTIEPLPPITTRSGRRLRDTTMKVRSTRIRNGKPTANSKGEVETLCVETQLATSPEKLYRELPNSSK